MGLPTQWVILWLVVGAVVGALVTALFVRRQRRVTRREHVVQLRRREASIDRLKATIRSTPSASAIRMRSCVSSDWCGGSA